MTTTASPDRTAQTIKLKDGRVLGYAEYGDPNGKPVLEFHGWPGSRLEAGNADEAGKKLGARVIGIDRPGFGLSTFKKGYRIVDWPRDVIEFADLIGIQKFACMGISSGSPYSLACARFISERLTAAAVVSGLAPLKVEGEKIDARKHIVKDELQIAGLAKVAPWLARLVFAYFVRKSLRDPDKGLADLRKTLPPSDQLVLENERAKDQFQASFAECMRQGTKGPIASVALEVKPWGFRLEDIPMHVSIWQGEDDNLCFPAGAAYMASHLKDHTLHMVPDAGHLTVAAGHAEDVLRELLAAG
jgi:pimeloyl-ACP methyl ester carboxylesterase